LDAVATAALRSSSLPRAKLGVQLAKDTPVDFGHLLRNHGEADAKQRLCQSGRGFTHLQLINPYYIILQSARRACLSNLYGIRIR
jgi:hypothetical protein